MDKTQEKAKGKARSHHKTAPSPPAPKGKLLAIGGKESKGEGKRTETQEENQNFVSEQILKRFVGELKGKDPLLVIIPAASSVPEETSQEYRKVFAGLGVKSMEVLDVRTRDDAHQPEHQELMDKAAGIIFTGGDQLRLTSLLGGSPLLERIRERYTHGSIVVAGTSAGASAMSTNMIYAGEAQGGILKGQMSATKGLDLLQNVAIDTHFIDRGRIIRMAQAVAQNPGCIGIGLEEDTAILVTEGKKVEVIGSGLVTILDGMDISSTDIYEIEGNEPFTIFDLRLHLLANGKTYTIPAYSQKQE